MLVPMKIRNNNHASVYTEYLRKNTQKKQYPANILHQMGPSGFKSFINDYFLEEMVGLKFLKGEVSL